jgi:hypothetical protein
VVEPWDLADDAVVPLRVVDRFDVVVNVNSCFKEAEFLRESDFA